jgi:hypothetical protein
MDSDAYSSGKRKVPCDTAKADGAAPVPAGGAVFATSTANANLPTAPPSPNSAKRKSPCDDTEIAMPDAPGPSSYQPFASSTTTPRPTTTSTYPSLIYALPSTAPSSASFLATSPVPNPSSPSAQRPAVANSSVLSTLLSSFAPLELHTLVLGTERGPHSFISSPPAVLEPHPLDYSLSALFRSGPPPSIKPCHSPIPPSTSTHDCRFLSYLKRKANVLNFRITPTTAGRRRWIEVC